jgi:hypothetical protein
MRYACRLLFVIDPKVTDPLLNPNFKTRYFIVGAEWFFAKNGKIYTESKLDNGSVTATGAYRHIIGVTPQTPDRLLRLSGPVGASERAADFHAWQDLGMERTADTLAFASSAKLALDPEFQDLQKSILVGHHAVCAASTRLSPIGSHHIRKCALAALWALERGHTSFHPVPMPWLS